MPFPTTKITLLNHLNGDDIAWNEFFARYSPVIADIGKFKGLTPVECEDLVQTVMIRFHKKITEGFKYDRSLAKFRTFFSIIISGCIVDIIRQRDDHKTLTDDEIQNLVDNNSPDELLDMLFMEKWRDILKSEAMIELAKRVDEKTFQAFELHAIHHRPIKDISALLNMSGNQIYVAKNRCTAILKEIIARLNKDDPDLNLHE
ncbi:MAG: sigma-70 family RNA polymerase sigma factor [Victivallales bacterium]|nr:sigma-70 family RNA polymerase sigma factor [Victivallales bacterium]